MSKFKGKAKNQPTSPVARAVASVGRAVGRLVDLLGDEDLEVVEAALLALAGLGGLAVVGPLAAGLRRAPGVPASGSDRRGVGDLRQGVERAAVLALRDALRTEGDPHLSLAIRKALAELAISHLVPSRSAPVSDPRECHEPEEDSRLTPGNRR